MVNTYNDLLDSGKLFLIAGPCVIEREGMALEIATYVNQICEQLGIQYIFKASYRKANRSSGSSFTGIGDVKALEEIAKVGKDLNLLTTTDIHKDEEATIAARYVDILQIPAFLCRQTSLLAAAAQTGKMVNIKKGQFMSPESMKYTIDKVQAEGNTKCFLTERGTTFGYQDLVVDFRSIPVMNQYAPVIMDCTHSLQQPNQPKGVTGGQPHFISTIANAAVATGARGLFIETHPDPSKALSDGANMLPLSELKEVLLKAKNIYESIN